MDGSAWGAAREFAFHCREDALNHGAFSIQFCWKAPSHLQAPARCLTTRAALSGDDAIGLQLLAAKGMIAFGIKFGVGQHTADWSMLMRLSYQRGQRGAVVPGRLTGMLGQNQLPLHTVL